MKLKQYLLFQAWLYAALAVGSFILSIPIWEKIDAFGFSFAFLVAVVFAFLSYRSFKQRAEVREEDRAYAPPTDATVNEQIKFYKKQIYLSIFAFPILAIIIALDLNDLESGAAERVRIWAPVAYLYEQFGYWVAILSTPILGILVVFGLRRKINKIKYADKTN